eukprot:SAG11_NODE_10169_length_850_cov_1.039947_2_plen_58_part_01
MAEWQELEAFGSSLRTCRGCVGEFANMWIDMRDPVTSGYLKLIKTALPRFRQSQDELE